MPQNGSSSEFVQRCEDEMAMLITACDHVDRLRTFGVVLQQRGMVTPATYRDYRDSCDCIAHALMLGRHNTARLRNGGQP